MPIAEVRDLAGLGDGVATVNGRNVFIRGAYPGERVKVRTFGGKKGARAKLLTILTPSPDRVPSVCEVSEQCGGCPFASLSPEAQRRFKRAQAQWAVGRPVPMHPAPALEGYRRRARLAFDATKDALRIGYREAGAHRLVEPGHCVVLTPVIEVSRRRLADLPLQGTGEIQLDTGQDGLPVAVLRTGPQPAALYRALEDLVAANVFAGFGLHVEGVHPATFGDPRPVSLALDGAPLVSGIAGFTQAYDQQSLALASRVQEWAAPTGRRVVELYAGSGHLSVALGAAASLTVVEQQPAAAAALMANLKARGIEATVHTKDAASVELPPSDVAVLDPPRSGAREALAAIERTGAQEMIYVSCSPATLRRDRMALGALGFVVADAEAFDFFPHPAHVEAVVRFRRAAAGEGSR
ncbi:MAG: hypothetical protein AAGF12_21720 [Myxococcota bacterium]